MRRDELKRLIQGPIAAVGTPFDDRFAVDHGRLASATEYWVEGGLVAGKAVLKVASFSGELPMLRDEEVPALVETVVRAARGKATIVCGVSVKDTLRTIEDVKRAESVGAVGVQISPPLFNEPTQDDLLRYFEAVSKAVNIGIIIYTMPWLPYGNVAPETIRRMADFEHVVSIKWAKPTNADQDELQTFAHIFNVIDNTGQPARSHKLGARGYINDTADVYPPHDLRVWDLLEDHKYEEAEALHGSVSRPIQVLDRKFRSRAGGQARAKKGMMALMGHPMGDSRPPSLPLNHEEMVELRELLLGFGWPVLALSEASGMSA